MRILVTGASGFVGGRLGRALIEAGHEVRGMTRRPDDYDGPGTPVYGDVGDPDSLTGALDGCDAAYYLVHSLASADFEREDADAARAFAAAAATAKLRQVVYLGGLGDDSDDLSAHLRSRRQVERLLADGEVPTTTLRAAIIIGHGGVSWEMTRQLVEHLPAMITPHWVSTRCQPIAVDDAIAYLVGVLDNDDAVGRTFEIGGPDVLRYSEMLTRLAQIEGRRLFLLGVPFLTPDLSSHWLSLVTDVDTQTARSLIGSMSNEVVVRDRSIHDVVHLEPMGYDAACIAALKERAEELHEPSDARTS